MLRSYCIFSRGGVWGWQGQRPTIYRRLFPRLGCLRVSVEPREKLRCRLHRIRCSVLADYEPRSNLFACLVGACWSPVCFFSDGHTLCANSVRRSPDNKAPRYSSIRAINIILPVLFNFPTSPSPPRPLLVRAISVEQRTAVAKSSAASSRWASRPWYSQDNRAAVMTTT